MIGLLTVGESPREDIEATFRSVLGETVQFAHAGALDNLDDVQLEALSPRPGETPNETRLADGRSIVVADERLETLLAERCEVELADCAGILLVCTGDFPTLRQTHPHVRQPHRILRTVVSACATGSSLGVVGPTDAVTATAAWAGIGRELAFVTGSPYGSEAEVVAAVQAVAAKGADLVVLDCMGFTDRHQALAMEASNLPVICSTTMIGRLLPELFNLSSGR